MTRDLKATPFQKIALFSPRIIMNSLFGLALVIVTFINIISFFQVSKLEKANTAVIHTYQVIQAVNNGFLNLIQIETAVRGFIVTNNQKNLDSLEVHKTKTYQNFATAKRLTRDNPIQQNKLQLLEPMLIERMDLFKKAIQTAMDSDKSTQITIVNQGLELTNKISALVEDLTSEELNLLEQRNLNSLKNSNQLNTILWFTSILSALLFILGFIGLNLNLTRQKLFLLEKLRYENLLGSIVEGTNDIILALDLDFRFIIYNRSFELEFKTLFGKRPRIGASIVELLAHLPSEQKKVAELWQRALQGEEFSLVGEFGGFSSVKNFYECNFNSIFDEHGALIGASAICRNIEHLIESEKTLQASNEKLENAYNVLKQHDSDVSLLNEMENSLQSCNSIAETFLIINKYCQKLLPFTAGVIYLLNPSRNYLEDVAEWNSPKSIEKVFSPQQCWGLRQGKNYIYLKKSTNLACEHMRSNDSLSYFCIPLLAQNDVIGLLHMLIIDSENSSEEEILELYKTHELLIKNLAAQLALAIANIQLRETLKTRSIRDPLTGLYNRMYLSEFLERDLQRSKRENAPVFIVMMDIDYFKKLNDNYGHDAGDMVLKDLGQLLQDNIRGSDIICRYGGEEFLLILYDTNFDIGHERVEKLRILISQLEVSLRGTILDRITASFGLAIFPKDGTSVETLITAADRALYQSKKNGRNQVTVYNKSMDTE
ncbi:MAG: diguanylate cyclase [Tatlockia sp.]|nr:diguanylate cyclase [Tatlockia sp.]